MTDKYVSYSTGNDAGSGAIGDPWKEANHTQTYNHMVAGGNLYLKSGDVWRTFSGNQWRAFDIFSNVVGPASLIHVGVYGGSEPAVLDTMEYEVSAGWAHVSGGIWRKAPTRAATDVPRRLLQGAAWNTLERSLKPAPSLVAVGTASPYGDPFIWWWDGTYLNVFTNAANSTVNPVDYYQGLAWVGSALGLNVGAGQNFAFEGIRIRGGTIGWAFSPGSSNVTLTDCFAEYQAAGYFGCQMQGTTGSAIKNITLIRPTIKQYAGSDDKTGTSETGDAFSIYGNVSDITITDMDVGGYAHSGLNIVNTVAASTQQSVVIRGGTINQNELEYGRGVGINPNAGSRVHLSALKILGQAVRSQISGDGTHITGCVWDQMRLPSRTGYTSYGQCVLFSEYDANVMSDVTFSNNTIMNPYGVPIAFSWYGASGTFNANAVKLVNNIIVDVTNLNHASRSIDEATGTDVGVSIGAQTKGGGAIPTQTLTSNCVYTGTTGGNIVKWNGSASTLAAAPGTSGNIETNPLLQSSYKPLLTSPCIATGTWPGKKIVTHDGFRMDGPYDIGSFDSKTPQLAGVA